MGNFPAGPFSFLFFKKKQVLPAEICTFCFFRANLYILFISPVNHWKALTWCQNWRDLVMVNECHQLTAQLHYLESTGPPQIPPELHWNSGWANLTENRTERTENRNRKNWNREIRFLFLRNRNYSVNSVWFSVNRGNRANKRSAQAH